MKTNLQRALELIERYNEHTLAEYRITFPAHKNIVLKVRGIGFKGLKALEESGRIIKEPKSEKKPKPKRSKPFVFDTDSAHVTIEQKPGREVHIEVNNQFIDLDRHGVPCDQGEVHNKRHVGSVITVRM